MEPLEVNRHRRSGIARGEGPRDPRGGRPATRGRLRVPPPHELSGGQRQRVVIAGALVMDPEVIVADEPVSMLDVSIRTELLRLMLDLRKERGLTYLFITHDLALAWVIADRIAVMYLGRIMEVGPAEAVIRSPQEPLHRRRSSRSRRHPSRRLRASAPGARSSRARPRTRPTSRRAVDSTRAARRPSIAARPSRRLVRPGRRAPPPAGWPSRAESRRARPSPEPASPPRAAVPPEPATGPEPTS